MLKREKGLLWIDWVPHKLEAYDGPVKFIEISTFHEDNDSYRVYR